MSIRGPSDKELEAQRKKFVQPQKMDFKKDAAGLYPYEILMLFYAPKYKVGANDFPKFWYYTYAVKNPEKLLKKLLDRGFIRIATAKESLNELKTQDLKSILQQIGQPVSGKKPDLITRIQEAMSEQELGNLIKGRNYAITESGNQELRRNEHIPYVHQHGLISMDTMCALVDKNPNVGFKDLLWGELNRVASEYARTGEYGFYRNTKYDMYSFMMEEKQYPMAFLLLSEAFFYDMNGECDPLVAPAFIRNFRALNAQLDYSEARMKEELGRLFDGMVAPHRHYSNTDIIKMIIAYSCEDNENAEKIFNKRKL